MLPLLREAVDIDIVHGARMPSAESMRHSDEHQLSEGDQHRQRVAIHQLPTEEHTTVAHTRKPDGTVLARQWHSFEWRYSQRLSRRSRCCWSHRAGVMSDELSDSMRVDDGEEE